MGTPHTGAKLDFEGDGWVGYTPAGKRWAVRVHFSYKPTPDRWVVDKVHMELPRITARDLRDLPIGKIETWVNILVQQGFAAALESDTPKLADDLQFADPAEGKISWIPKPPPAPTEGAKGDEFYRHVGEIYAKAALASPRPAAELAEAWGVPLSTVHRWVRVARRRGHLPPTEKGRKA